ncbi:MAG: PorV/PorQ family protein [bacterium]
MRNLSDKTSGTPPGRLDRLIVFFGRPWVFALAFAFLLIPSQWLVAAMNTGAAFLKIDTGARPTAMGGAYTALADDVNALYYNPGGLGNLRQRELGATHTQWLMNTTFDFFGYAHPLQNGTLGLGVTRLGIGQQEGRDANRQAAQSYEASDTAYTIGYSRRMDVLPTGRISLGGNFKYLQSRIGEYSASAVAFDAGALHTLDSMPLSLGFSVLNIGKGMTYLDQTDPLPLTFSLGAAYRFAEVFQVTTDIRHEAYDHRTSLGIGTEYALMPRFSIRAGYTSFAASGLGDAAGALGGLGGGFGLKLGRYRADYTFTPFGALGNAQRLSLGARF